ncbi:hypothetical protein [Paenibacillus alginolyticus]|uniref:Uncharacterized protein n=1 Tax=Paenibacillus alginolyticus TaxID=59839 RepID=A0ABT4G5U1_9BACL|nr:hypothetical protein [Paenibacillus alginolyticus]MCY9691547.1 hypothetical protein [Paenibacillus alginolyticus]MEC0147017.1 hypothetical protein [Paenibacillus alginolyticus]
MAEMRHQASERGAGNKETASSERKAGGAAQRETTYGDWLQLQRTVGNRMVGELLKSGVGLSAAPTSTGVQRAPGLPTRQQLKDEGLKAGTKLIGKTSWASLDDALYAYEKLGDTDYRAQEKQMQKIEVIIGKWRASYDQRANKEKLKAKDPAKLAKVEQILADIRNRRVAIQTANAPTTVGQEGLRGAEASHVGVGHASVHNNEEKKEVKAAVMLNAYLRGQGYKLDRNYLSWAMGEMAHVSWKAHVGSSDATQRLAIAQAVSPMLRSWNISHKFDSSNTQDPIDKFLTVYPPEDEEDWELIVKMLEGAVGSFATVDVAGDMPVGETGKVNMRHGQNTTLTLDMLKGLDVKEGGSLGSYKQYVGSAVHGGSLPLLINGQTMFFSKTMDAPALLNPQYIYMAILVGDRIVPDKREEPNPAKVPLPPGIKAFERQ